MLRAMAREKRVLVTTSFGSTSECAGTSSSTSSKVKASPRNLVVALKFGLERGLCGHRHLCSLESFVGFSIAFPLLNVRVFGTPESRQGTEPFFGQAYGPALPVGRRVQRPQPWREACRPAKSGNCSRSGGSWPRSGWFPTVEEVVEAGAGAVVKLQTAHRQGDAAGPPSRGSSNLERATTRPARLPTTPRKRCGAQCPSGRSRQNARAAESD